MQSERIKYEIKIDGELHNIKEKKCDIRSTGLSYKVLKYDESIVCDNDEKLGKYRSLVLSEPEGRLVCYTPPKTITPELFKERNPAMNNAAILTNELVEGTLITLFWDDRANGWEIATKGSVGGNYWFYRMKYPTVDETGGSSQKTFRRMFLDALRAGDGQDINDVAIIKELLNGTPEERLCYNFILQHPDNHIVIPVEYPILYLISVYGIKPAENIAVYYTPDHYPTFEGIIEKPRQINSDDVDGLISKQSPHNMAGVMLTNLITGDRTSLENESYNLVREIRGNNPNLQYQYLFLRSMNKVDEFLGYFPQYKKFFYRFFRQYENFITEVHQSYLNYYIKKSVKTISKKYFPVIYKLHHEVYIPSLSGEKIIMKKQVVRDNILKMTPSYLIHFLNYDGDKLPM